MKSTSRVNGTKRGFARILVIAAMVLSLQVFVPLQAQAITFYPNLAVNYSNTWATGRNPSYAIMSGTDCANFVSQSLYYGGLQMVGNPYTTPGSGAQNRPAEWWFHTWAASGVPVNTGNSAWTFTWSVAENLRQYVSTHGWHLAYTAYGAGMPNLIPGVSGTAMVVFYNWTGGTTANHASFQVVYNATDPTSAWVGTLINQHVTDRYHAIWHLGPYNTQYSTTRVWVYSL